MIVKNILSSNRSFAFARGPVPMRSRRHAVPSPCPVARTRGRVPLARPHRRYTRALPGRRDRDIAPYRHYAPSSRTVAHSRRRSRCRAPLRGLIAMRSRRGRARCPHRAAAPWRGARLGIPRHLPHPVVVPHRHALPLRGPVAVRITTRIPWRFAIGAVRGLPSNTR